MSYCSGLKLKLSPIIAAAKNVGCVRLAIIAVAKAIRTQELKHDPSRYAKNQIG
jgi:hypothetical protein